jgi:hypothetical protein
MDSRSSRALLLVRLALLGVTLCVAVAVYGGRFRDDPSPTRVQLNGRTSQGFPVWAVRRDGRLREVHLIWRGTCTHGSSLPWSTYTVRDGEPTFEVYGRDGQVGGECESGPVRWRVSAFG